MQDTFEADPSLVKADIGGMSLAYVPKQETFLVLNGTATVLLTILEQGVRSRRSLEQALVALYPKSGERKRKRCVDGFLYTALQHGMVRHATTHKHDVPHERIKMPLVEGDDLADPIITPYEKKWIIQNHPDAVYEVAFGDHWSPAGSGGGGTT